MYAIATAPLFHSQMKMTITTMIGKVVENANDGKICVFAQSLPWMKWINHFSSLTNLNHNHHRRRQRHLSRGAAVAYISIAAGNVSSSNACLDVRGNLSLHKMFILIAELFFVSILESSGDHSDRKAHEDCCSFFIYMHANMSAWSGYAEMIERESKANERIFHHLNAFGFFIFFNIFHLCYIYRFYF